MSWVTNRNLELTYNISNRITHIHTPINIIALIATFCQGLVSSDASVTGAVTSYSSDYNNRGTISTIDMSVPA